MLQNTIQRWIGLLLTVVILAGMIPMGAAASTESSVTAGPGQNNDTSVDMLQYEFASDVDATGNSVYIDNTFTQGTVGGPRIELMLKKGNGEWITLTKYTDTVKDNCILGIFPTNNVCLRRADVAGYRLGFRLY